MARLENQDPATPDLHEGKGARRLSGRFAGWFSCTDERAAQEPPRILRRPETGEEEVTAPGCTLRFDPARAQCHVDARSITLLTGRPRVGSTRADANAREIAEIIQRERETWHWLGGRFALVHIDLAARCVWLVCDRFGVEPICFARDDERVQFADRADEVPSLAPRGIEGQAIYDYAYFHIIPATRTIFRGVSRVEPAQGIRIDAAGARASFWWRPAFEGTNSKSPSALKAQFRDLLRRAVEREATTDRVGTYLSGGTDSSTVSGLLRQVKGRPTPSFSIGFDAAGYDEMSYARIAAKHFGTDQHEYYVTPDDLVRAIPAVAASYDQPFGNSSAVPAYYCALQAREANVERLLAGDGGDELFGGNTRYAKQKVFAAYGLVPALLRANLLEPLLKTRLARQLPLVKKAASYVQQALVPMPDRMETYNLLDRFGAGVVFTDHFLAQADISAPAALQREVYDRTPATASLVDRMLAYDWRFTLADNDLPKVVGTASLAGVGVGFPFLDDDLVDFSLTLGPSLKVRGLTLRWFFKEALRGFLPDEIIRKSKHGFGLPFGPWLVRSAPLRQLAQGSLEQLAERGVIRHEFVKELFSTRLQEHAGYFGEIIWIFMMLEHWLAAHAPAFRSD